MTIQWNQSKRIDTTQEPVFVSILRQLSTDAERWREKLPQANRYRGVTLRTAGSPPGDGETARGFSRLWGRISTVTRDGGRTAYAPAAPRAELTIESGAVPRDEPAAHWLSEADMPPIAAISD